jgi:hypothetical protein
MRLQRLYTPHSLHFSVCQGIIADERRFLEEHQERAIVSEYALAGEPIPLFDPPFSNACIIFPHVFVLQVACCTQRVTSCMRRCWALSHLHCLLHQRRYSVQYDPINVTHKQASAV